MKDLRTFFWLGSGAALKVAFGSTIHNANQPVCIVGAGPAGLTAAKELEDRGYKTAVFEQQPLLGGKCQSYYGSNGVFHPLGAAFYSNASYEETVKIIDSSGVPSVPISLALGRRETFAFNWTDGSIIPIARPPASFNQLLAQEVLRYASLWNTSFAPFRCPGYKNGVPRDLTVPAVEWLLKHGLTAISTLLINPIALYGYGSLSRVPALYILQYITPDILEAFVGNHTVGYIDFHKMWMRWAERHVKGPIHTHSKVIRINRSGHRIGIEYAKADSDGFYTSTTKQQCSAVVLAFPPTIENLRIAGVDLRPEEEAVFAPVRVHNYFSSAVEMSVPYNVSYIASSTSPQEPPPNVGEPVALLRLDPSSPVVTSWSWGPDDRSQSAEEARDILSIALSQVNKDPRIPGEVSSALKSEDVKTFRKWDYFPHFDSAELRGGWYQKLSALQGQSNTYWVSGLNGMETVEWVVRASQDVVRSYF